MNLPAVMAQALRRLRRAGRSGELLILMMAVAVAVASHAAVALFSERMSQAISAQTGDTLGGDWLFSSRNPLPDTLTGEITARSLQTSSQTVFPSVVFVDQTSALASVKAVDAAFPTRGSLRVADRPFESGQTVQGGPPPGEAWGDARLWQALGVQAPGVSVQLGGRALTLTRVVIDEPGRGAGFSDLAPRLLVNLEDAAASGLLNEGARAQYGLLARADAEGRAALGALALPDDVRRTPPQGSRPELTPAPARADTFLAVASSAASLLAAAAIALSAWQFGLRLRDEVALLKCLGASGGFILQTLGLMLALLGLLGGAVGAALGWLGQAGIAAILGELIQLELPPPSLAPLFGGGVLALLLVLGFGLPPLVAARNTPPARVFQRAAVPDRLGWGARLSGVGAVLALLLWQTSSLKTAAAVIGGGLALALLLGGVGFALVRLLAPLRQAGGAAWRFGLGNLVRRQGATVGQLVALGVALVALLLVSVVQRDLLNAWRDRLPEGTPNQFFINIQPGQVAPLKAFFAERDIPAPRFWPQARGRLMAINGQTVTVDTFDDPETQRWINRDFNLSWSTRLNDDNAVHTGQWWGEAGRGQPWLSIDDYVVERLGVGLGDSLTLDFAGDVVTLTVTNIRTVRWDSFQPNFFLLAPPGVLDGNVPTQYLTSAYLDPTQRPILRDLVAAFPNVTALDIDALLTQVRGIMDRIVRAVELIFLFALAAGLLVLLSAMIGTRDERAREVALLRTLGARRSVIRAGLLAEYAVLGLLAGLTAAMTAQLIAWGLAAQVFQIPYGPRPMIWVGGGLAGATLVTVMGLLSVRRALNTPPAHVLRGE